MANESGNMEQILGTSIINNETRFIKTTDTGTLLTQTSISDPLPLGNNLIGATMPMGDVAMVMRDSLTDPTHLLLANATYKSPVIDRPRQSVPDGMTRLWIKSSSTGVLYLEEHNNYNPDNPDAGWTTLATVNVSATVSALMAWSTLTKQYMRFKFVNGAVAQTEFILNHYTQGVGITPTMVADGNNVTLGTKNDTANIDPTASGSVNANLKGILKYTIGTLINNQTNKAITASTNILTANYTAINYQQSTLMVSTSATGILSLAVDGVLSTLNSGVALDINKWYAFDVLLLKDSTYNLQLSVDATMQIKWVGGA